ncbi:putative protease Do-like 14 [Silene latifolia]|uniref:putative protease Do-like 14 n=1 Tax=Silene latifolia TaxID=37657 RepID=UPI003D77EEB1
MIIFYLQQTMGKRKKRSFVQMEQQSVDGYIFSESERDSLKKSAREHPRFNDCPTNDDLNVATKMAALKASHSIVSLVSFSGENVVFHTCGTIIEVDGNTNTVITSLHLLRERRNDALSVEHTLIDNLKIVVQASDENSYIGKIETYDFHYNLLIVKFESKNFLQPARLRMIDDDFRLEIRLLVEMCPPARYVQIDDPMRPHDLKVQIGDPILVVARYFKAPNDVMAAPGTFSIRRCQASEYGCGELLSADDCDIRRCGDGAPYVNLAGEVIAIAYYELGGGSPFLPINIAYKWWNHYKKHKEHRHPSYGFKARNIYAATLCHLARFLKRFPSYSNGVQVVSVLPGSYAESAGLRDLDVIVKCDGKTVKGFLQLWELMWDKVGDVVKLKVARVDNSSFETITMVVGEAVPDELNKWPQYDYC